LRKTNTTKEKFTITPKKVIQSKFNICIYGKTVTKLRNGFANKIINETASAYIAKDSISANDRIRELLIPPWASGCLAIASKAEAAAFPCADAAPITAKAIVIPAVIMEIE
jgi:hypothetical protein